MQKNKIFISYRQSDTQSEASRLKENLEDIFGADRVFFDIETLEPGLNFAKAIEKTLFQSAVVLVLIGETWIDVKDEDGNLRLFQEDDWVRKEVAMALEMDNTRVIPVLVKDAKKLSASQLPDNIKSLADFQWAELTIPRWRSDVERLAKSLEKIIPPKEKKNIFPPNPPKPKSWWARNYLWVLGVFVVLIIIGSWPTDDYIPDNYDQNVYDEQFTDEPIDDLANIYINYTGDEYNCNLKLKIKIGGKTIIPTSSRYLASGIDQGIQNYTITGSIGCPTMPSCNVNSSGTINIIPNTNYYISWRNSAPGACEVMLNYEY